MSKSKSPTEWLNPILDDFFAASTGIEPKGIPEHARTNARQAIQAHTEDYARRLCLEVIGEDERLVNVHEPHQIASLQREINHVRVLRNALKATQRKQLEERIGKSDDN